MASTRTLVASIGASVSLVVAAALSLLAASAMFAFGGWSDPVAESVRKPTLVVPGSTPGRPGTGDAGSSGQIIAATSPIVVPAPARLRLRRAASRPGAGAPRTGRTADRLATRLPAAAVASAPAPGPPAAVNVAPAPPPAVAKKRTGDGVRTAGEGLSAKVQNAGTALAQVTEPLAPPISAAVQDVLNIVAALARRSTSGLGGVLDALLPAK